MSTIGILAGMGPRSTGPFVNKVVAACRRLYGAQHDMDFPPMMIYSLPTPFRPDMEPDHDVMQAVIGEGLVRLAETGVAFIAMPCNTAHLYYEYLAEVCPVPLLNMVDLALGRLPEDADSTAVFGTRPTIESGFYQSGLALRGKTWVVKDDWQERVNRIIDSLKAGEEPEKTQRRWSVLLDEAKRAGADTAVLACTDLNAIVPVEPPLTLFDATETLAEETVNRWLALQEEMDGEVP